MRTPIPPVIYGRHLRSLAGNYRLTKIQLHLVLRVLHKLGREPGRKVTVPGPPASHTVYSVSGGRSPGSATINTHATAWLLNEKPPDRDQSPQQWESEHWDAWLVQFNLLPNLPLNLKELMQSWSQHCPFKHQSSITYIAGVDFKWVSECDHSVTCNDSLSDWFGIFLRNN